MNENKNIVKPSQAKPSQAKPKNRGLLRLVKCKVSCMAWIPTLVGMTTSRKTGFTLVELSIVIVIIGLIVGGVLVGQDLIKSAEIRSQISQIEQYIVTLFNNYTF